MNYFEQKMQESKSVSHVIKVIDLTESCTVEAKTNERQAEVERRTSYGAIDRPISRILPVD